MKEIIKVLIKEGIDSTTIHKVLDTIEEEYDIVDEGFLDKARELGNKVADTVADKITRSNNPIVDKVRKTKLVAKTVGKRALNNSYSKYQDAQREEGEAVKNANALKGKSIFKATQFGDPQSVIDRADDSQTKMRQARKDYHNTVDKYGFRFTNPNDQKIHTEYQKTHDEHGNKNK